MKGHGVQMRPPEETHEKTNPPDVYPGPGRLTGLLRSYRHRSRGIALPATGTRRKQRLPLPVSTVGRPYRANARRHFCFFAGLFAHSCCCKRRAGLRSRAGHAGLPAAKCAPGAGNWLGDGAAGHHVNGGLFASLSVRGPSRPLNRESHRLRFLFPSPIQTPLPLVQQLQRLHGGEA